ncbi:putative zeaxanthin epoxidase [Helianthus anomalus]
MIRGNVLNETWSDGKRGFIEGTAYKVDTNSDEAKKNLWILCRENQLDEEIYNQLVKKAEGEGYDVSKLKKTTHTNPPPETKDAPADKGIWWLRSIFGK